MEDQTRSANRTRLEALARELAPTGPASPGAPGVSEDEEPVEIQVDVALKHIATGRYRQVLEALSKVGDDTYGICDNCRANIAPERLEIIPEANLCVGCQKKLESCADFAESNDDADYLVE